MIFTFEHPSYLAEMNDETGSVTVVIRVKNELVTYETTMRAFRDWDEGDYTEDMRALRFSSENANLAFHVVHAALCHLHGVASGKFDKRELTCLR